MKRFSRYLRLAVSVSALGAAIPIVVAAQVWEPATPHPLSSGGKASVERGKALYASHCVDCHGVQGKGAGSKMRSWPKDQFIPDLTSAEYIKRRGDEIVKSLREGRRNFEPPYVIMPEFRYILSDEDMKSVIAYVRSLGKPSPGDNRAN